MHNGSQLLSYQNLRLQTRTAPTRLQITIRRHIYDNPYTFWHSNRSRWWHNTPPSNALGNATLQKRTIYLTLLYVPLCAPHYENLSTVSQRWLRYSRTRLLCSPHYAIWFLWHGASLTLSWIPHITDLSNLYLSSRRITDTTLEHPRSSRSTWKLSLQETVSKLQPLDTGHVSPHRHKRCQHFSVHYPNEYIHAALPPLAYLELSHNKPASRDKHL